MFKLDWTLQQVCYNLHTISSSVLEILSTLLPEVFGIRKHLVTLKETLFCDIRFVMRGKDVNNY